MNHKLEVVFSRDHEIILVYSLPGHGDALRAACKQRFALPRLDKEPNVPDIEGYGEDQLANGFGDHDMCDIEAGSAELEQRVREWAEAHEWHIFPDMTSEGDETRLALWGLEYISQVTLRSPGGDRLLNPVNDSEPLLWTDGSETLTTDELLQLLGELRSVTEVHLECLVFELRVFFVEVDDEELDGEW
jgi:hypothetical protein